MCSANVADHCLVGRVKLLNVVYESLGEFRVSERSQGAQENNLDQHFDSFHDTIPAVDDFHNSVAFWALQGRH